MTLRNALRRAPDGLPHVSTYTIGQVLHAAGFRWVTARSWCDTGKKRQPHEYVRNGTAKLLTLFCPGSGEVHARGVTHATNAVLRPWLQQELAVILERLP